jgi:hypothetical protein
MRDPFTLVPNPMFICDRRISSGCLTRWITRTVPANSRGISSNRPLNRTSLTTRMGLLRSVSVANAHHAQSATKPSTRLTHVAHACCVAPIRFAASKERSKSKPNPPLTTVTSPCRARARSLSHTLSSLSLAPSSLLSHAR